MADEELEVIKSIYCKPGEIFISHGGNGDMQVKVKLEASEDLKKGTSLPIHADLCFMLSATYPATVPAISVFSDHLSRTDVTHLRSQLCGIALKNVNQPMLMELISFASDELHKLMTEEGGKVKDNMCTEVFSEDRLVLLHLDHMRLKTQYSKLIKKWTEELSLCGCLIFCQRLILILLQGSAPAIKEYIVRQRTNNVDVDSKGHPCKERMLSVLHDTTIPHHYRRLGDFTIMEFNNAEDLKQFFTKHNMQDLFIEHVQIIKQYPGK